MYTFQHFDSWADVCIHIAIMDQTNIIGNLAIPYLCITAKTSSKECLSIHEDFIATMREVDEEIERENKFIDETVTSLKRLREGGSSELSEVSFLKDFFDVTESISDASTPALMNNTAKLVSEWKLNMRKIPHLILDMSEEEWSGIRANIMKKIRKFLLWGVTCLKSYNQDFHALLFLDHAVFKNQYKFIYSACLGLKFIELTITDNDRLNNLVIPPITPNLRKNDSLSNKLKKFEDVHEVISYSGTDECTVCFQRSFTNSKTRFIINDNPDCRHIICSYCMYKCYYILSNQP